MKGIYLIKNVINNDIYVGRSVHLENRWSQHLAAYKNKDKKTYNFTLYRAFRKYGIENFVFMVLEEIQDSNLLPLKEQYYYDLLKPSYNMIEPQDAPNKVQRKKVYMINQNKEIVKEYESVREAARQNNISKSAILNVLKGIRNTAANHYWSYSLKNIKLPINKGNDGLRAKKVAKIDSKTNQVLDIYKSISDAARQNKLSMIAVSKQCQRKVKYRKKDYYFNFINL